MRASWRPNACSSASDISPTVARRLDRQREQIGVTLRALGQGAQRRLCVGLIAFGAQALQLVELLGAHAGVIDLAHVDRAFVQRPECVDTDHRLGARIDARLGARRRFLDAQFWNAGVDRAGHAAERFDLAHMRARLLREVRRQPLDIVRAAPRIDDARRAALLLQE
jgi:hypothetical protein